MHGYWLSLRKQSQRGFRYFENNRCFEGKT